MKLKTNVMNGLIAQETSRMCPVSTQQLFDDLFAIRDGFTNVFLIRSDDGFIAIDGGIHAAGIRTACAMLNIDPKSVNTVLLTHSDIDHVGGLGAFPEATIYLPENEVAMIGQFRLKIPLAQLEEFAQHFSGYHSPADLALFPEGADWPDDDIAVSDTGSGQVVSLLKNQFPYSYQTIGDGECLTFGGRCIKAILIDGHTTGLTAYQLDDSYLFVGDGMSLDQGHARPFNTLLNRDEAQHLRSLRKLKSLSQYRCLLTQHYGYTCDPVAAFSDIADGNSVEEMR